MNTFNQLSTLEQSKKLKELGIAQESLFTWVELIPDTGEMVYGKVNSFYPKYHMETVLTPYQEICSAFTESELAVMLDAFYETYKTYYNMWDGGGLVNKHQSSGFQTPCQASAATLIHLLEDDERLTSNACNERLNQY